MNPSNDPAPGNGITRRSFMKKSALTIGAVTILARGEGLANPSSGAKVWEIRAAEVALADEAEGSGTAGTCLYDELGHPLATPKASMKTLQLIVTGDSTEWGSSATSNISIVVQEHAKYEPNPTTEPDVWVDMTDAQFAAHRGGMRDVHEVDAALVKSIDGDTGEVTRDSQTPLEYNETKKGINITLSWNEDTLNISFGGAGVPAEEKSTTPNFPTRHRVISN